MEKSSWISYCECFLWSCFLLLQLCLVKAKKVFSVCLCQFRKLYINLLQLWLRICFHQSSRKLSSIFNTRRAQQISQLSEFWSFLHELSETAQIGLYSTIRKSETLGHNAIATFLCYFKNSESQIKNLLSDKAFQKVRASSVQNT